MSKKFKNLNKDTIKKIVIVVFFLVLIVIFLYIFKIMSDEWVRSLRHIFGPQNLGLIFVHLIVSVFAALILYFIIYLFHLLETKKFNTWLYLTLCCYGVFLYVGFVAINLLVGVPILDSVLKDTDHNLNTVGEINCFDSSFEYLIGSQVTCNIIKPTLIKFESEVTLIDSNNSKIIFRNNNSITFPALNDTRRIEFKIIGRTQKDFKYVRLEVGRNFKFLTQSESIENRNKRFAYTIGLLGIVLFSIPAMMINLRDIYRDKKKGS